MYLDPVIVTFRDIWKWTVPRKDCCISCTCRRCNLKVRVIYSSQCTHKWHISEIRNKHFYTKQKLSVKRFADCIFKNMRSLFITLNCSLLVLKHTHACTHTNSHSNITRKLQVSDRDYVYRNFVEITVKCFVFFLFLANISSSHFFSW